jgi:biofilm PGA synthesis N-glycosyltransferase PgaC
MILLYLSVLLVFFGFPFAYYLCAKRYAGQDWSLSIDELYTPTISLLIPTYNEEGAIQLKLENLCKLEYPIERIQIILVDSASTDKTLDKVSEFIKNHPQLDIEVIQESQRSGKSKALNHALKHAKGDVIVVSDADCFLSPKIMSKALPYLADRSVGAVTGREVILNPKQSWVTESEIAYRDFVNVIRLGESKSHSTIFFEGGFGAYKRAKLEEFDSQTGADDSGTAFNIVQKGDRTLFIPEATFFTVFPHSWKGKAYIKLRRASQLLRIWLKCLNLLLKGQLSLPKKIAIPEIFLFIFNPIVFLTVGLIAPIFVVKYPISLVLLATVLLIPKSRMVFFETIQNNCILLGALISLLFHKKFVVWNKVEESRSILTGDFLEGKEI